MLDSTNVTFAYQPIVDIAQRKVISFEALARGPNNEPASWVLARFQGDNRRRFDTAARQGAIQLAAELDLPCSINLNLLASNATGNKSQALDATIAMATQCGLQPNQVVLEVSERETIANLDQFMAHANRCRALGVQFAIDDFGAGFSGLNLLADFQPDSLKIDIGIVRDIFCRGPRQAIVRGVIRTCEDLGIDVVAEGVESFEEYEWLRDEGIVLFQGHLFARPAFQALPDVTYPP